MLKTYEKIICFNHRIQAGSLPLRSNEDERGGREREESFQNDWQSCILVTATLKRGRERGSFQNDWQSCILVTATLKRGRERGDERGRNLSKMIGNLASSLPLRSNEDERGIMHRYFPKILHSYFPKILHS